jgi:hypothetical protein
MNASKNLQYLVCHIWQKILFCVEFYNQDFIKPVVLQLLCPAANSPGKKKGSETPYPPVSKYIDMCWLLAARPSGEYSAVCHGWI